MQNQKRIHEYLLQRGLSEEVINEYKITFDGKYIVIPIYDFEGNFSFNKYRRDPNSEEGPKYKYDAGAQSTLFNGHKIKDSKTIFITEGEMDALRLISAGYMAVSSTGGSGTFREEWVEKFQDKEVYICYDNDSAGMRGAIKVQAMLPSAKIVFIPREKNVKDVTDYFKSHFNMDFKELVDSAKTYPIDCDDKELRRWIDEMMNIKRGMVQNKEDTTMIELVIEMMNSKYQAFKHREKYKNRTGISKDAVSNLQRAKQYPVTNILKFNNQGYASCPWHSEKTPSLYLYQGENRVHCFSCGARGDVIDVVMQVDNISFKDAIAKLSGM